MRVVFVLVGLGLLAGSGSYFFFTREKAEADRVAEWATGRSDVLSRFGHEAGSGKTVAASRRGIAVAGYARFHRSGERGLVGLVADAEQTGRVAVDGLLAEIYLDELGYRNAEVERCREADAHAALVLRLAKSRPLLALGYVEMLKKSEEESLRGRGDGLSQIEVFLRSLTDSEIDWDGVGSGAGWLVPSVAELVRTHFENREQPELAAISAFIEKVLALVDRHQDRVRSILEAFGPRGLALLIEWDEEVVYLIHKEHLPWNEVMMVLLRQRDLLLQRRAKLGSALGVSEYLTQIARNRPRLWIAAQRGFGALRIHEANPEHSDSIFEMEYADEFGVLLTENFEGAALKGAIEAVHRYGGLAGMLLQKWKHDQRLAEALAEPGVGSKIIMLLALEKDALGKYGSNKEWVDKVVDEQGRLREDGWWRDKIPGGQVFYVFGLWLDGKPITLEEMGLALVDAADLTLTVLTFGGSAAVSAAAKIGRGAGKIGLKRLAKGVVKSGSKSAVRPSIGRNVGSIAFGAVKEHGRSIAEIMEIAEEFATGSLQAEMHDLIDRQLRFSEHGSVPDAVRQQELSLTVQRALKILAANASASFFRNKRLAGRATMTETRTVLSRRPKNSWLEQLRQLPDWKKMLRELSDALELSSDLKALARVEENESRMRELGGRSFLPASLAPMQDLGADSSSRRASNSVVAAFALTDALSGQESILDLEAPSSKIEIDQFFSEALMRVPRKPAPSRRDPATTGLVILGGLMGLALSTYSIRNRRS
ncbi:MAG: hypothetical protein V3W41_08425 [Planctomycetota bacterium]